MPKLLVPSSLSAVLAAAAVAAGCGADDVDPAALANAAEATRNAETARFDVQATVKGLGLPGGFDVEGRGVTALDAADADLDLDLGPLLAFAGAGAGAGDGTAKVIARGKDLYVDPPQIRGLALPGGADWVKLDLAEVTEAAGIDAAGLADVITLDAGTQLDVLRSAKDVEEVGEEEVDGVPTTHLRGTVSLADYAKTLPADRRKRAEKAIEQLTQGAGGDEPMPFDVWIDEDDRVRRMTSSSKVPAQQGTPAGSVAITMDFDDFGTPLSAKTPPKADTWDATDVVRRAVAQQGGLTRE